MPFTFESWIRRTTSGVLKESHSLVESESTKSQYIRSATQRRRVYYYQYNRQTTIMDHRNGNELGTFVLGVLKEQLRNCHSYSTVENSNKGSFALMVVVLCMGLIRPFTDEMIR